MGLDWPGGEESEKLVLLLSADPAQLDSLGAGEAAQGGERVQAGAAAGARGRGGEEPREGKRGRLPDPVTEISKCGTLRTMVTVRSYWA